MPDFPQALHVGHSSIQTATESWEDIERDPRGYLLMFEPPKAHGRYIMGMDTAEGITGWSRGARTDDDRKKDNSAIEVFEVDAIEELCWKEVGGQRVPDIDPKTKRQRLQYRDVQVAEFAAPCDPVEAARVANVIGRIYKGREEDQCELIWESWPGCGMLATQELLRLGYGNLWHWEYIADVAEETNRLGWRSSRESMKLLWFRARRHLMHGQSLIRSQFLLDEYANAEIDMEKMRARAAYGAHDDRFIAANLCFWAGHEWTQDPESTHEVVTEGPPVEDYQRRAPGFGEEFQSFGDWRQAVVDGWED